MAEPRTVGSKGFTRVGTAHAKGTYALVLRGSLPAAQVPGALTDEYAAVKEFKVPCLRDEEARDFQRQIIDEFLDTVENDLIPMKQHPNIARYFGAEFTPSKLNEEDRVLLLVEWCDGQAMKGKFDEALVQGVAAALVSAVSHLHEQGLYHENITPKNVFLNHQASDDGVDPKKVAASVKLTDYCIFKAINKIHDPVGGAASIKQLPQYTAPEVFSDGGDYDMEKVDVWAIGCTVLEALTGKAAYSELGSGGNLMFKILNTRNAPQLPDGLSADATAFLTACFNRDGSSRPSAIDLLQHPWIQPVLAK